MSDLALASAHHAGSILAACAGGALLLAHPERYKHWADSLGPESARVRLVDWLSQAGQIFQHLESGLWLGSQNLVELEMPLRGLLMQLVGWTGRPPIPDNATLAAQAAIPLLGVAQSDPYGFDACEAPTIPTPVRSTDALESLGQDLVDESSEVRLLLGGLIRSAGLDAAMVTYRNGESIACLCAEGNNLPTGVAVHTVNDATPLILDLLDSSDLYFSLGVGQRFSAVRLTGAHAMLIATATTRLAVEHLRDPSLGFTLNCLLKSFRFRVGRSATAPTLTTDDFTGPLR